MGVRKIHIQKLGGNWTFWDSVGFPFRFATWREGVEWMDRNEPSRRKSYVEYYERLEVK